MTATKPIPFLRALGFRIDEMGSVFRLGRPPTRTTPISRQAAEDVARRLLGGTRKHGEHIGFVVPKGCPPAGDKPMVLCLVHRPDAIERGDPWRGRMMLAWGDTEALWYRIDVQSEATTYIFHGPSLAAELFAGSARES